MRLPDTSRDGDRAVPAVSHPRCPAPSRAGRRQPAAPRGGTRGASTKRLRLSTALSVDRRAGPGAEQRCSTKRCWSLLRWGNVRL